MKDLRWKRWQEDLFANASTWVSGQLLFTTSHGKIKVLKFIDKGAQFTEKFEN